MSFRAKWNGVEKSPCISNQKLKLLPLSSPEISPFRYATVEMTSSMFRVRSEPIAPLCHFERSETESRNLFVFPTKHCTSNLHNLEIPPFRYATVEMTSSMFRVRSEPIVAPLCHFEQSETESRNLLAFPTKSWNFCLYLVQRFLH